MARNAASSLQLDRTKLTELRLAITNGVRAGVHPFTRRITMATPGDDLRVLTVNRDRNPVVKDIATPVEISTIRRQPIVDDATLELINVFEPIFQ